MEKVAATTVLKHLLITICIPFMYIVALEEFANPEEEKVKAVALFALGGGITILELMILPQVYEPIGIVVPVMYMVGFCIYGLHHVSTKY